MSDDLISRQALLDKLNEWDWQELYLPSHFKELIVDEVPSVQPKEKKTGKWIIIREVLIPPSLRAELEFECKCSECGYVQVIPFGTKFCYHCGQALDWSDENE